MDMRALYESDYVRIQADTALELSRAANLISNYVKSQHDLTRSKIESAESAILTPLRQVESDTRIIMSTVDSLESAVDNVIAPALVQIQSLVTSINDTVPMKLQELQTNLQEAESTITNDIQGSKDDIIANLTYATDSIRYDIQALGDSMKNNLLEVQNDIERSITHSTASLTEKLEESANLIVTQVGQKAVEIEAAVKAGTEEVGTELQQVRDDIIQAYTTSVNELVRLAANIEKILTDMYVVDEKKFKEELTKSIDIVRNLSPNFQEG